MEALQAARALSALGHETRLAIFKILVQAGPDGVPAGEIAQRLGLAPATLSFHLKDLAFSGLVSSHPQGRYVYYSASFGTMSTLMSYLTENCCNGASCAAASQHRQATKFRRGK